MPSPTVDQLRTALADVSALICGITAEQWTAQTPCGAWDVRELVSHLVGGNGLFAAALRGGQAPPPAPAPPDDDLPAAFDRSGAALLDAFDMPGAMQRVITVPFGTVPGEVALHLRLTEMLVHGWDIARATGQPATMDDAIAEQELQFSQSALGAIPPERSPFDPPQQTPAGASAVERLAALLGRRVA